jgi:transposase InsO family protein
VKFAFISEEQVAFPIAVMCRVLSVSTSGYYAWKVRPESLRSRRDVELGARIRIAHGASSGRYGSPRVHADLHAAGEKVGRKRVARLMKEAGLAGRMRLRFRKTTDSNHSFPIAPNVLERDFRTAAPNQAWVTDITYLWTREGWLYLAVLLDLFSRRVVSWATSASIDRHLALTALRAAVRDRRPGAGLIHHSDRGSTYASGDYRSALESHAIECSMSRKGDCWDNAVAESFFATLKREIEEIDHLQSHGQANAVLADYIDRFYNFQRRHSTIGYRSPVEFELMYCTEVRAA